MTKIKISFALLIVGIMLLIPTVAPLYAQPGGEDLPPGVTGADLYRVTNRLYCEVCQGVPISACPSVTCAAWRQEVADMMGEGYTDEQIMEYFADRYGGEVTGVPIKSGDRWLALGLPAMLTLVIGGLIAWQIWRLRSRGDTRAHAAARAAGLLADYDRPVPDNVDEYYLERFLQLLEDRK